MTVANAPLNDLEWAEVDAVVHRWIDGGRGRFAHARVTGFDAASQAICEDSVGGLVPPVGEPFRCRIVRAAKGWRVREILVDGLPDSLEDVCGIVVPGKSSSGLCFLVRCNLPRALEILVRVPLPVLWKCGLAWLDEGTPAKADIARGRFGWEVSQLKEPEASASFPNGQAQQSCLAWVLEAWPPNDNSLGAAMLAVRVPEAPVTSLVRVSRKQLRRAGIRRLVVPQAGGIAASSSTCPDDTETLLGRWEQVLFEGQRHEVENLGIDRLKLELDWISQERRWRAVRLVKPRSGREPGFNEEEVHDLVDGTVQGTPTLLLSRTSSAQEGDRAQPPEHERYAVSIDFFHKAIGRAEATAFLGAAEIRDAGLNHGTRVVFRLKSRNGFWNVDLLHRSLPVHGAQPWQP